MLMVPLEGVELENRPRNDAADRRDPHHYGALGSESTAPITPVLVELQSRCSHERLRRVRAVPLHERAVRPFGCRTNNERPLSVSIEAPSRYQACETRGRRDWCRLFGALRGWFEGACPCGEDGSMGGEGL